LYAELFNAVFKGDIATVKELTINQPVGKQVHVCCSSNLTGRTPLLIAAAQGNLNMALTLLDIASQQFTPLKFNKKEQKVAAINNWELANDPNYQPGNPSGSVTFDSKQAVNCLTSPNAFLSQTTDTLEVKNWISYAILNNYPAFLEGMFNYIRQQKITFMYYNATNQVQEYPCTITNFFTNVPDIMRILTGSLVF
jgi:hypothetical protein